MRNWISIHTVPPLVVCLSLSTDTKSRHPDTTSLRTLSSCRPRLKSQSDFSCTKLWRLLWRATNTCQSSGNVNGDGLDLAIITTKNDAVFTLYLVPSLLRYSRRYILLPNWSRKGCDDTLVIFSAWTRYCVSNLQWNVPSLASRMLPTSPTSFNWHMRSGLRWLGIIAADGVWVICMSCRALSKGFLVMIISPCAPCSGNVSIAYVNKQWMVACTVILYGSLACQTLLYTQRGRKGLVKRLCMRVVLLEFSLATSGLCTVSLYSMRPVSPQYMTTCSIKCSTVYVVWQCGLVYNLWTAIIVLCPCNRSAPKYGRPNNSLTQLLPDPFSLFGWRVWRARLSSTQVAKSSRVNVFVANLSCRSV